VPFGEKDEFHSGFVFGITKNLPEGIREIKEISDVIEEPLFDEDIRDLFLFTATQYLLPLHFLVNQFIKTIVKKSFRRYIHCIDFKAIKELSDDAKGTKKEFLQYILKKEFAPVTSIKKYFGNAGLRYVRELTQSGFVKSTTVEIGRTIRYITLAQNEKKTKKMIEGIERKLFSSTVSVVMRLKNNKTKILDEKSLIKGIKYGKETLEILLKKNILKEVPFSIEKNKNLQHQIPRFIQGNSLEKRTEKIIRLIKKEILPDGKTLVIFPERALIQRVEGKYRNAFGDTLFVWKGKGKRNLLREVNITGRRVILATSFSLFIEISNLKLIVMEDASSRYFRQSDFLPFNALVVALKRASLEKTKLIFSSMVPGENVFFLAEKGLIQSKKEEKRETNIHIVDMRKEFKYNNRKMLSRYLIREIKRILNKGGNVALLLNRKAYATFIMCRECGYVIKCPNCNVSLYYDKEKNKLVCPICGYEMHTLDICPRCGSPSIQYFGGGVQKLIEQVKKLFPNVSVVKMVSSAKASERKIIDSKKYSDTVFIGTEFLLSHLLLNNILLFGFVSIDVFLHHFAFDAAMNTFQVVSEATGEMGEREVVVQTYLPEHYVVSALKNMDYKHFFKEEFLIRKELSYPPFKNLIIFTLKGRKNYETMKNGLEFKEVLSKKFGKEVEILGPSPAPIEKRGGYFFYELSIKTGLKVKSFRNIYFEFLKNKSIEIHPEVHLIPIIGQ